MKRILLVEDDPDIQMVTSLALGSFGRFAVKVCGSAREALESAPASASCGNSPTASWGRPPSGGFPG